MAGTETTPSASPTPSGKPFISAAKARLLIPSVISPIFHTLRSTRFFFSLLQDISNSTAGVCDECVKHKELKANWGQSIHLACPVRLPDMEALLAQHGPLRWYHYRSERSSGFEVFARRDKFVHTNDNGLVVLGISERESGRYECKLGTTTLCRYNVAVDASKCWWRGEPSD